MLSADPVDPLPKGKITNIADADQLLHYAAQAQFAKIGFSQNNIAELLVLDKGGLSKKIHKMDVKTAKQLDAIIIALAPEMDRSGGLGSLAVRLRGLENITGTGAEIPAPWTRELLKRPADDEFGVLTQASALLSMFRALQDTPHEVRMKFRIDTKEMIDRYREEIRKLVDQLLLIGGSPPTPRNIDALVLLGSIGAHAFDLPETGLQTGLEWALRDMPLGFRAWRAVTKLVHLSRSLKLEPEELKYWVKQYLEEAEELREVSLYPGRSLDLELAITVPLEWSPPGEDWAGAVLLARARNTEATVRERGTAALGLWERTVRNQTGDRDEVRKHLEKLIVDYTNEAEEKGAATGLRWVATTLRHLLDTGEAVCITWPEGHAPCRQVVADGAAHLKTEGIPDNILENTITLFEHALLQNAGVHRRQAIDTLLTGGWARPVTRALERVLKHEKAESWLRCRALFALGFLQVRDAGVVEILKDACIKAHTTLATDQIVTKPRVSELHAGLCAVADCFGATGSEVQANNIRRSLDKTLRAIVYNSPHRSEPAFYPVFRATAYVLLVTAQPRVNGEHDMSQELLEHLTDHPDEVTSRLSTWALAFRFADDGTIRPLHQAPLHIKKRPSKQDPTDDA
ncbi:hypothetical protein ACFLIM_33565 [Nonomuraea sp. M3C6]|uniref:HEAT repeat-containing protein n=1 Tax=Nonomuraea marmarensis TaxID=3351344 RepID=A0ABW7AM33_9ACTN